MSEDPSSEPARIVVGVSSSPASRRALAWAAGEARLRHAVLHAVFAWQYPFEMADGTYVPPMPNTELADWADKVLAEEVAAAVPADVEVRNDARCGSAAPVLLEVSEGADLLVVGTSGHGRITGLLLGSTSQFLAVHAHCPVVVIHGPRHGEEDAAGAGGEGVPDAAAKAMSTAELGELGEIGEEECLALLAGASIGRLVVVAGGQPLAFPVNYVLDGRTIAVRTDPGTKLDAAALGKVAFEVDRIDDDAREGWSVLVQGVGRDVTEGIDAWSERVRESGVTPWATGDKRHWIAIAASTITGRRIRHGGEPAVDG
ncbi:MAG TPA: universal stress protein [Acidimicrobiales bacterium]|nr:universal stress protein [Acidimicrobiales bacterium]